MGGKANGLRLRLSPARKLVAEMLHHARKQPSVPVARAMNLGRLPALRAGAAPPPSWTAVFLRAYALVARRFPELRRAYVPWPRAHLYEHPFSIGAVAVEREVDGEKVPLAARIISPEEQTLASVQRYLTRFKHAPLASVSDFRQLLCAARLPAPLRRLVFWSYLNWGGSRRARRFGTFMVSSYGSLGAEQLHPLTPLTTLLTFGPISPAGDVVVKIVYDHRVMDGRRVAAALVELEGVLRDDLAREVAQLPRPAPLSGSAETAGGSPAARR